MSRRHTTAQARPARRHGKHRGHQGSEHSVPSWMPHPDEEKCIVELLLGIEATATPGLGQFRDGTD